MTEVKTFSELSHETREQLCRDKERGVLGRRVEVSPAGVLTLLKSAVEIEEERKRKQRHARILAEIAALEGSENLPKHALKKLTELRKELAEHEAARSHGNHACAETSKRFLAR